MDSECTMDTRLSCPEILSRVGCRSGPECYSVVVFYSVLLTSIPGASRDEQLAELRVESVRTWYVLDRPVAVGISSLMLSRIEQRIQRGRPTELDQVENDASLPAEENVGPGRPWMKGRHGV